MRNLSGEQGADCQESTQSFIFSPTISVMNWNGRVELRSRFPPFTKVSFQPGLPQFYNVLEFTFTYLLTILWCSESLLYVWPQPLPYGVTNCGTAVSRRREAEGESSAGHTGILSWFLEGHSHKILWKGQNLLCIRMLSSGSWLVLIFMRNVRGICGSLAADVRCIIWFFFSGPETTLSESKGLEPWLAWLRTASSVSLDSGHRDFLEQGKEVFQYRCNSACAEVGWQKSWEHLVS